MSCRVIALTFGYVESATTSWLIYHAEGRSPETRKDAIHSLTEYMYDMYRKEVLYSQEYRNKYKSHMSKCCQKIWRHRNWDLPDPISCSVCGASFITDTDNSFSVEDWKDYLHRLHSSTSDDYGDHDLPPNPHRWSPWGYNFDTPANKVMVVPENAEVILTIALAEIHPELKDNLAKGEEDDWPVLIINDQDKYDNFIMQEYLSLIKDR